MRMNESEVEVKRSQQDLFGGHHFVTQVPVFLRTKGKVSAGSGRRVMGVHWKAGTLPILSIGCWG